MSVNQLVLKQVTHMLPPNATKLEKAVCYAIAMQFYRQEKNVKRKLWNADACPENLLPWLAWTVGLEEWNNNWPERLKRAQIRDAIPVAKKRGTRWAIRRSLANYGVSIAIKLWHEYTPPKAPYTFDVTVVIDTDTQIGINSTELMEAVKRDIDRNKSLRDHYTLTQGASLQGSLKLLGGVRSYNSTHLKMQSNVQALQLHANLLCANIARALSYTRMKFIVE